MKKLKRIIKRTYLGGFIVKMLKSSHRPDVSFPGSEDYWEKRYQNNSTSGSGSYGRLAEFKAEVLNKFVDEHDIQSVIEFGCGDGNQLRLAIYPSYKGFDVSKTALELCRAKFREDPTRTFYDMEDQTQVNAAADLSLSLDVLYHLIEDHIFDLYMNRLFKSASEYVIIYSSNYDDHFAPHVKCRKFTNWIENNLLDNWTLMEIVKNEYPFDENNPDETSMADFYIYKKE
jgi:SAM-dependent methyltransferase